MPDISGFNAETRDYFNTLPNFIQETIMQSSIVVNSKADLERYVNAVMEENPWHRPIQ